MSIEIYYDVNSDQDWINIIGECKQFHIYQEEEDYVESTAKLMQKAATKCFQYPFYIHFEGYEDCAEAILLKRDVFDITYQDSGRTVLTMSDWKTYHAGIPAFTVMIPNAELLKEAFKQWFHFSVENCMWAITQKSNLQYQNQFAMLKVCEEPIILIPDHDACGLSMITNDPEYQTEEAIGTLFDD